MGIPRWFLWLKDISPAELREMPHVKYRMEFLFERYHQLTSLLPTEKKTTKRKVKL